MSQPTKRSVILCVDDEPDLLLVLGEYLISEGFSVVTANSGEAALDIVKSQTIDLILLDMAMPKMSGIETLSLIKQINRTIPAVMITAYRDAEKVVETFRLGACDCIFKPFDLRYLRKILAATLVE